MNKNNIYRSKLLFWNNDDDNLLTFVQKLMNSGEENLINRHNINEWIKFFTCISQSHVRISTIRKILKNKIIPLIMGMLTFKNKKSRSGDNVKQFEYIDGNDIDSKEYSNYLLCFEIIKCLRDNFFRDNIYNYPWYLFDWEQFEPIHAIQCLYTYLLLEKPHYFSKYQGHNREYDWYLFYKYDNNYDCDYDCDYNYDRFLRLEESKHMLKLKSKEYKQNTNRFMQRYKHGGQKKDSQRYYRYKNKYSKYNET